MMEGVPGAGKSTLAAGLVARAHDMGLEADLMTEETIFSWPEFAEVGRRFRSKNFPTPDVMLAAYGRIFEAAHTRDVFIISEWNAVSMIEDLPCSQIDRTAVTSNLPSVIADIDVLTAHARDVRYAWGREAILLVLEVPVGQAVQRAADQRGRAWLERELARWPDRAPDEPAVVGVTKAHQAYDARRQTIIRAHERAGWTIRRVDASEPQPQVLRASAALVFDA